MRISDWSSDVCSSDLRSVRECRYRDPIRHPGLVPGSNVPQALPLVEGWMLEQVRHDGRDPCRTSEPAAHCSISTVEGWCLSRCFLMIRRLRVFDRKKKSGTAPTNGIRPSRKSRPDRKSTRLNSSH